MTPSNANTSGLEVVAFLLFNEHGHTKASTMPPADGGDVADYEPLVTAASAQARIAELEQHAKDALDEKAAVVAEYVKSVERLTDRATAAEARADRLAKALEPFASLALDEANDVKGVSMSDPISKWLTVAQLVDARAALQQEG